MENKELPKLTRKQQLFCDAYIGVAKGNGTEAARLAGYSGSAEVLATTASENLRKPNIAEYIQRVTQSTPVIMNRDEMQTFLTKVIQDLEESDGTRMTDRLKALELLNRMQGGFLERIEISAPQPAKDVLGDTIFGKGGKDDKP